MRFTPFAHLHVHSDFSLLASAVSVTNMLDRAAEMRQPAVAMTDHGNLFGAVQFYSEAIRRGIKPVMGCEVYLCDDHKKRQATGSRQPRYPQLVLLSRTNRGWHNLMRLVTISYLDGFYYKPRVDRKLLEQFGEGLIALSSGWDGQIEMHLRQGDKAAARQVALDYAELFPNHGFFIELQRHGAAGQEDINRQLIELAHETDIPLVASNDVHFLAREDFHAFEAMLALQQNRTLNDDVSGRYTPECYLKSYEEMAELFADVPEAIENSMHIASRCNVELEFGQYQLPDFEPPEGMSLEKHIHQLAHARLEEYWPRIQAGSKDAGKEAYEKRLDFELGVIQDMGFPGYFLIVADFIGWAKQQDIPVGPGRGSGAGSLVAYVLGITDLDPIRYGLLFERFLNPERVSLPDFDVDFCMSRRDEVIQYVSGKYGADHVAQIITYGSMKAKAVVRDVGRVLGMPYGKVDEIAKLIPNDLNITLDRAQVEEPKLRKLIQGDADTARLFDIAQRLEGLHRHAGKHAAGVVIGRTPLVETAPLYKDPREGSTVVQWDMKSAEKMGLIKFDFLGLKTLTVLHLACELVRRHVEDDAARNFDLARIPLDDQKTFDLLQRGDTRAVFQLESSGMRDLLTRIKPDSFEDIIALVALFRPGPLQSGMVDDFIACKKGGQQVVYPLPQLEPILKETYGVILYQEQVMKIAQELGGYSLGQADLLRRAMGKKNPAEMTKQRKVFMKGAAKQKIAEGKAAHIFDLMEKFAGYGFNKSHSAAYAMIAYQTAYLKAHYPQAFMAATLSCDMGNSDKVHMLVADCRAMHLDILTPDINASDWEFVPEGDAIRFGLGAVKGVGEAAIRSLVQTRAAGDPFESLQDMLLKTSSKVLNKRMLEALIKAGAMDGLISHRHAALEGMGMLMDEASRKRKEKAAGQSALFEVAEPQENNDEGDGGSAWGLGESLQHEREVLGFYLTGHPLEEYLEIISGLADATLADIPKLADGSKVSLPVGVSQVRTRHSPRGTMAIVQVEDLHADATLICYNAVYAEAAELLNGDKALLIYARVDKSREEPRLMAEAVALLDSVLPDQIQCIQISSSAVAWDEKTVQQCKALTASHPGSSSLAFKVRLADGSVAVLTSSQGLHWDREVKGQLESLFGEEAIRLRCSPWQPEVTQGSMHNWGKRVQHVA